MAPRGETGLELIRGNKNAFVLLYVIAQRARWRPGFNQHALGVGQAFLGDHEVYAMTEREYRTAKGWLQKHGFATFNPTNKGTVATIINTDVFDCNAGASDGPSDDLPTAKRPASDERPTTNEEGKKDKRGKMEKPIVHRLIAFPKGGSKGGDSAEGLWFERLTAFCEGTDEMDRTGPLFRLHYRADPDGWERVLAEAENAKREGRLEIRTTPGAYLTDLAKHWKVGRYSRADDDNSPQS